MIAENLAFISCTTSLPVAPLLHLRLFNWLRTSFQRHIPRPNALSELLVKRHRLGEVADLFAEALLGSSIACWALEGHHTRHLRSKKPATSILGHQDQ